MKTMRATVKSAAWRPNKDSAAKPVQARAALSDAVGSRRFSVCAGRLRCWASSRCGGRQGPTPRSPRGVGRAHPWGLAPGMAAGLPGRTAKAEPRHHGSRYRLSTAGDRPGRPVQGDAETNGDPRRRIRRRWPDRRAGGTPHQARLAPHSGMARANPHGLRHRRGLRVRGANFCLPDENRARHHRGAVADPNSRTDENSGVREVGRRHERRRKQRQDNFGFANG